MKCNCSLLLLCLFYEYTGCHLLKFFFLQWWVISRRQTKRIAQKHWDNINQFLVSIPHYKTINNGFPNKVTEAICNLLFVYWQTQSC